MFLGNIRKVREADGSGGGPHGPDRFKGPAKGGGAGLNDTRAECSTSS